MSTYAQSKSSPLNWAKVTVTTRDNTGYVDFRPVSSDEPQEDYQPKRQLKKTKSVLTDTSESPEWQCGTGLYRVVEADISEWDHD